MKLTFLWQSKTFFERDWIPDIFASVAGEQVYDGKHCIVLDNCLLIDFFLNDHSRAYYAQFRGKNAWLLHLSDETYEGGREIYRNFRGVFRNYRSSVFNSRRVMQLPLGYTNDFVHKATELDINCRKHVWSFVGNAGKSSRPEMMGALQPFKPSFIYSTGQSRIEAIGRSEYQSILCDSIFAPCPMGNLNLDSFRVYEALECGAIPILEKRPTLDYFRRLLGAHPLPTFGNWRQAARFIASMLADRGALANLQKQCIGWWDTYKQSLRGQVENFFETSHREETRSYISWRHSLPGWQSLELLRHHSMPALARRIKLPQTKYSAR